MSNKRRDPRFDADLPVRLRGSEGDVVGNLRNVSVSGAAIEFDPSPGEAPAMFEIGDSIDLRTDAGPDARGVVVRRDEKGIAVKFDKLEEELMADILATVRRIINQSDT